MPAPHKEEAVAMRELINRLIIILFIFETLIYSLKHAGNQGDTINKKKKEKSRSDVGGVFARRHAAHDVHDRRSHAKQRCTRLMPISYRNGKTMLYALHFRRSSS